VAPDLELWVQSTPWRKAESERAKVLKEISIVDRGGGRRTIDLVLLKSSESSKRTRAVDLERIGVRRSDTLEGFTLEICVCGEQI
jgi:hypothetical protein